MPSALEGETWKHGPCAGTNVYTSKLVFFKSATYFLSAWCACLVPSPPIKTQREYRARAKRGGGCKTMSGSHNERSVSEGRRFQFSGGGVFREGTL